MKRKNRTPSDKGALDRFTRLPVKTKRRLFIKSAVATGILGITAVAISGYDAQQRELHDLGAIGTGKPVVVQIHDTSCPTCRKLKSRSTKALEDQPGILFRVADIATPTGHTFQKKHKVQKTTLLLFNAKGRLVGTVIGLQTVEQLESLFAQRFKPAA